MCLYLLHGSLERIPGLPVDRETLSLQHLSRHVRAAPRRAAHRSSSGDAHTSSLAVRKKVRGRLYGLEFRLHFVAGEPCADALIPFGAPVDLSRFMHHLRGHHTLAEAPGDWDFGVFTDVRDLRESVVRFGNGREVWFQVGNHRSERLRGGTGGRLANGRSRSARNRGRLVTGRLQGNRFGTRAPAHAGGVMFPDPLAAVEEDTPEARAYRRWVARLRDPLPLRVGRTARPEFGTGPRPR
ncbi:hypothetical protein QA995_26690 [Streptomyces scabiei]|uniref:hypothetical protein n=1 Tax=Streptomyces scabiei TaxID=1930 RepID=UPI002FF26BE0